MQTGSYSNPEASADLLVARSELNFGSQWQSRRFPWSFEIANASEETLRIDRVVASCACTKVSPGQFELEPGGTQLVSLTINLADRSAPDELEYESSVGYSICS